MPCSNRRRKSWLAANFYRTFEQRTFPPPKALRRNLKRSPSLNNFILTFFLIVLIVFLLFVYLAIGLMAMALEIGASVRTLVIDLIEKIFTLKK